MKEDIKTYYVKSNKTNALISLNQIEKAINAHDCKTLQDLSNYFNLPTTHLFAFFNILKIKPATFHQIDPQEDVLCNKKQHHGTNKSGL
ncbi:MAG: hypothetical protein E6350_12275 [Staphylococcus epidermidis]|nr:hypothetical protein [Staphylococcus epidermidis]